MKRGKDEAFPQNGFEAWGGYMQAKISKLEEQFSSKSGNKDQHISNLFNGISIYVNGYTKPSSDELKNIMLQHGGVYHTYQRTNDFIIASNLPDTKVKNQSLVKVVKPEWITDSLAAEQLLNYKHYLLYNESRSQPKLSFIKSHKHVSENFHTTNENCESMLGVSDLKENFALHLNTPGVNNTGEEHIDNLVKEEPLNKPHCEVTRTAADPNFISDFYNNSRLHHISQLGAGFKQYINDLRDSNDFSFTSRKLLQNKIFESGHFLHSVPKYNFQGGKIIMHIDMDCFFVSVGLRSRPELRGKPVAVTHAKTGQPKTSKRPGVDRAAEFNLYRQRLAKSIANPTGLQQDSVQFESKVDDITDEDEIYGSMSEIASCSYEARSKGITNGMFMGAALKLCPDLIAIPYDFDGYKEVAYTLYNTIAQYILDIEAVSCDEMYVDCTDLIKSLGITVDAFASALRQEIKSKTGCPCSTGFGGNRLQARLATKKAKPDGQYFLSDNLIDNFMIDIKLRDLPGVGRQTSQKLEALGHQTCGSLQCVSLSELQRHLGNKTGALLYDQCRGRDPVPLSFYTIRKSVSAEVNYGIRFENQEQCTNFLTQLSSEVHNRMQQFKVSGKCITLKLMIRAEEAPVETAKFMGHGFCNVINKSITLAAPTNDLETITREVLGICKKQNIDPKEMRGIGIQVTKLESTISKNVAGTINKFLTVKNHNFKIGTSSFEAEGKVEDKKHNNGLLKTELTPKKNIKVSPSKKRSPILNFRKSPTKKRRKITNKPSTSANIMNRFLNGSAAQPSKVQLQPIKTKTETNVAKVISQSSQEKFETELTQLPWKTVRDMLRAWVNSKMPPLQCDINFLTSYLTNMVLQKRIDKLYVLINFLKRRTEDLGMKEWLDVYSHVLGEVQNVMLVVYGKKLLLN